MKVYIGKYSKDATKERKISVRVDKHDTWNMDETLAYIIHPMLLQLRDTKHGAPYVTDEDVPDELKKSAAPPTANEWETDDNHFKRWDWVLNEMIFAFESKLIDWEDQFWLREPKFDFSHHPEDEGQMFKPLRWVDEGECDWEGRKQYEERIANGFRLFGKYYQSLWD